MIFLVKNETLFTAKYQASTQYKMKKVFYHNYLFLALLFSCFSFATSLDAQLSFSDRSDLLNPGDYHSGISVGISDMNGDGFDDIVRLSEGRILFIEFQKKDGTGFETLEVGPVSNSSQWTLSIADVDNNGFNDIMTAGYSDGVKLVMADATGDSYSSSLYPGTAFFAQGSNFVDINNDGWVDAFVCDDDAESKIWLNDKLGKMLEANETIDMATVPSSDNSGNYGSVWTDFDNDGDLDLYIAKCRQSANSSTDPRRINTLYVNDGNNNFTERAEEYGLKIGAQSWTAEFQDIDNDGDFDCFITNHDSRSQMFRNDGTGHFTDISLSSGMDILDLPLQGLMRDFDNDGYVDIIVAGSTSYYYRNNGDNSFYKVGEKMFGELEMHSYGIGDLNHDGFLDVYGTYAVGFTEPSNKDDLLWLNDGNDNNYLAVNLKGVESNRNGIGARLEIYGDWGIQIREVRAGESYGIHNTFSQHFGLGTATSIDSLIIKWPSGIRDKIEDVPGNQFITIEEGGCVSPNSNITLDGELSFCSGDSLVISAPAGYTYLWSNGASTPSITVYDSGSYNVSVSDANNCEGISQTIMVSVDPVQIPEITLEGESEFCPGSSVFLTSTIADSYIWSSGESSQEIEVSESGVYSVTVQGLCGDFQSEEITLAILDVPVPITENDTVIEVGMGLLKASGEDLEWFATETDNTVLGKGSEFVTPELTETTTYWVEDDVVFFGDAIFGAKENAGENGSYTDENFKGITVSFFEPVLVKSMKVYAETAGIREVRFYDAENADNLGTMNIDIPAGESRIEINKEFPKSDRIFVFINNNAGLYYDIDPAEISFPYAVGEFGEILGNSTDNYYYFYDWEVEAINKYKCISQRSPATVVVEAITTTTENFQAIQTIHVFPNPVNDRVTIHADLLEKAQVQIIDLQGRILLQDQLLPEETKEMEIGDWAKGIYFVKITAGAEVYFEKIVLQN